ncbi:MAG: Type 1 glutamine amidotransferase-like domain-containing protein, partial [Acidobacteriota bacterium]
MRRLPGEGWLALIGGGEFSFEETEHADAAWLAKRPVDPDKGEADENDAVGFVPAASGSEDYANHFTIYFDEYFDRQVVTLPLYRGRDARRGKNVERIQAVGDLYLAAGVADHLLDALRDTPSLDAMLEKIRGGGTVAAIAAGAQALGVVVKSLFRGKLLDGFGWLPGGVVETNFEPKSASERRLRKLLEHPRVTWGLGIAASSVVLLGPDGEVEVFGQAWILTSAD